MLPTSTSSRAAPDGPMPFSCVSVLPVAVSSSRSSLSAAFFALVDPLQVADQLGGNPPPRLARDISRVDPGQ
jgi:hypothetical protein